MDAKLTTRHIRWLAAALLGGLVTGCGSAGGPAPPIAGDVGVGVERPGTTLLFVSFASIDKERAVAAAIRVMVGAAARHDEFIVYPVTGTAAGSAPAQIDDEMPPPASNPIAQKRLDEERAEARQSRIKSAFDSIGSPSPGTTVDLVDLITTGVVRAESIRRDGPTLVVIITSGFQGHHDDEGAVGGSGPVLSLPPPPADGGAEIVLLGIGDFGGVKDSIDPALVQRVIADAEQLCRAAEPRSCHVLSSLEAGVGDADPGGEG